MQEKACNSGLESTCFSYRWLRIHVHMKNRHHFELQWLLEILCSTKIDTFLAPCLLASAFGSRYTRACLRLINFHPFEPWIYGDSHQCFSAS